jgi:hypothetical protein
MDPMEAAIEQFKENFTKFRENSTLRLLRIISVPSLASILGKLLRIEEWNHENQRPFLIFHTAFTNERDTFEAMCRTIVDHYTVLKKGLKKNGTIIPKFDLAFPNNFQLDTYLEYLHSFTQKTCELLDPPYICWLPTDIQDENGYVQSIIRLIKITPDPGYRFVITEAPGQQLISEPLAFLNSEMTIFPFEINNKALQHYFKKLILSPPSKGRAPGTLPGSAAPDIEPPKRLGPPPPTDEQIKAAADALGVPPMLNPDEGQRLRQFIMEAAIMSGEKNEKKTIAAQKAAVELCMQAGVKLEQALMTMLLATYLLQFQRNKEAEEQYRLADEVAGDAKAYPQMAQIRLALGYLYLKNQHVDKAADMYEQAAAAAIIAQSYLLYWESLRMAGTCHLQAGRKREAFLCWNASIRKAEKASADEIANSGLLQIAAKLIKLLDENGYHENARTVEAIIAKAGSSAA